MFLILLPYLGNSVQFTSVARLCLTLCDPLDGSTPGLPVRHLLLKFTQSHVHWVGDAIQPSHPLSPSPPSLNLSQHQGLSFPVSQFFPSVSWILEFLLQHQSFQLLGEECNFLGSVLSQQKFEVTDQHYSPQTDHVTALGQISVIAPCYSSVLFRK